MVKNDSCLLGTQTLFTLHESSSSSIIIFYIINSKNHKLFKDQKEQETFIPKNIRANFYY